MATLRTNPRYHRLLRSLGLRTFRDFLSLSGPVVSGHADRHVVRLNLGTGPAAITAYLKRDHTVRWRHRWSNARAGFGFVSKSAREAQMLEATPPGAPDWIAWGEDDGRAFLLVREVAGVMPLASVLATVRQTRSRRDLARALAQTLIKVHQQGLEHGALYEKHIFVRHTGNRWHVFFLDWQEARKLRNQGWRDMACLEATLHSSVASARERLRFLRYVYGATGCQVTGRRAAKWIHSASVALLRHRRVRRMLAHRASASTRCVVWVEGEKTCLMEDFWRECGQTLPPFLTHARRLLRRGVIHQTVDLPDGRKAILVCRKVCRPLAWFFQCLRGRRLTSPELAQASRLITGERHGIAGARVLGFGQTCRPLGLIESFLLLERLAEQEAGGVTMRVLTRTHEPIPRTAEAIGAYGGANV